MDRRHSNGRRFPGGSDSGSTKYPYVAFARLRPAATQNGRRGSTAPSTPPSAGPNTKPMPNATPIMPNAPERFSGGVTSATYAMPVLTLAAVMPEMTRPTKSHARFGAIAIST